MTPTDRKYSKEHEWIKVTDEGVQLGITQHAQEALGDIVFVELPEEGAAFEKGDSLAVVESVKAVSNVYTPIAGAVVVVNGALEDSPELLNEAPYENYIAILKTDALDEAELLDAAAYDAFIASQA